MSFLHVLEAIIIDVTSVSRVGDGYCATLVAQSFYRMPAYNTYSRQNYLRISDKNVQYLIAKVKPLIAKQDIVMRNAITPEARIAATLRFLATGRSFEDLKFATIISPQALGKIIPVTCKAIYEGLKRDYLEVRNFIR